MTDAVLKLTPATAVSATIPDDRLVLASCPGATAVFADDVWDLSATEDGSRSASLLTVDFTYISHNRPAWKLAAKELAYHRLNTKLSPTVDRVQAYTCAREQVRLKRFVRWLSTFRPDIVSPTQLSQVVVHAYRMWLEKHDEVDALENVVGGNGRKSGQVQPETVWTYLSPIKSLDLYSEYLTEPMPFSPYGGCLTAALVGVNSTKGVNRTPPIADEVLNPLLTVAMRYVDRYWRDIKQMADERFDTWAKIDAQGWSKFEGWATPISECPDLGEPWREPLGGAGHHVNHEFREEMGNLIAACSTVALYLSGMRPREFCSLDKDCLHRVTDPATGMVIRWRIRGMPAKKKARKRKHVEWVVPEPAARAILILQEVLEPFRERRGTDLLLLNLDAFQPKIAEKADTSARAWKPGMDERSLAERLHGFIDMTRRRYFPSFKGRVTPSQFRRTLARHIARQPFGIIAGKLQYNHVQTAVFEGYAGSADDGFRLEIADEQLMAHVDLLEELRQDARDGCLLGPGADALVSEYDGAKAAELAEVMVDTSPSNVALGAATKSLAKRIYVGALNYCVWGTAKALCLTATEASARDAKPNISMCAPDKCGNSAIGKCHIPRWQGLLDEVDALMKTAKSGPQKVTLKQQSDRYKRVLAAGQTHGR